MAGPPGLPTDMPGLPVTDFQYNNARAYTSTVVVLFALSSSVLAMRLAVRWKSKGIDFDDYFIIGAAVSHSCLADLAPVYSDTDSL